MTNPQKEPNYRGLIDKNLGWNWRNLKFDGQLEAKSHKSKIKDHIKKKSA
jgi:hypothetical protein